MYIYGDQGLKCIFGNKVFNINKIRNMCDLMLTHVTLIFHIEIDNII